jgi:hypothetical protein
VGLVSHHLIQFTRDAMRGEQGAAFYSEKLASTAKPAEDTVLSA